MSGIFVPVDLDQVLDDFEEQEKNHHESPPQSRPDSLDLPYNLQDGHVQLKHHSITEPRTYSFNSPLDAMLKEHTQNNDHMPGKSLAQELADLNFGMSKNDDDDDDDDDNFDNDDIDTESDASSTTAVIVAAEKITRENNCSAQSSMGTSDTASMGTSDTAGSNLYDRNVFDGAINLNDKNDLKPQSNVNSSNLNPETEGETDFLSLLNLVVEENPFCLKESNSPSNNAANDAPSTDLSNDCKSYSLVENSLNSNVSHSYSTDTTYTQQCSHDTDGNSHLMDNFIDNENTTSDDKSENVNQFVDLQAEDAVVATLISSEILESSNVLPQERTDNVDTPAVSSALESQHTIQNTVVTEDSDFSHLIEHSDADTNIQQSDQFVDDSMQLNVSSSRTQEEGRGVVPCTDSTFCETAHSSHHLVDNVERSMGVALHGDDVTSSHYIEVIADDNSADSLCGSENDSGCDQDSSALLADDDRDLQTSPARTASPEPSFNEAVVAVHISSGDPEMGFVPPIWVPDEVATHCMTCGLKFSILKRKHHCRACGKVLCSSCCNMKYPLPYMGNKDARVCQVCCDILIQGSQPIEFTDHDLGIQEDSIITTQDIPDCPENHEEPPSVESGSHVVEPEPIYAEPVLDSSDVIMDDSLLDESDQEFLSEAGPSDVSTLPVLSLPTDVTDMLQISDDVSASPTPLSPALSDDSDMSFRLDVEHVRALIPKNNSVLPPVLNQKKKAIHIQEHPDPAEIMYQLKGLGDTVIFLLNKNLIVKVKIVKLRCCVKKKCWCFVTDGMGAANQEEMVVLLECEHNENAVPTDVLSHFNTAFSYAKQGHVVSDLGFTIFGQPFLGSSNNAGFLYIKPTFQCLENLPLPSTPYVVGLLIQRQEAPWAQLFPIRLMLRLGTEFRYYPCPLWSVRNRSSVYQEVGHTIMNLLTDFKNFQYSIPRVTGLVIHMEDNKTTVRLPQDRFDEMVKVLNAAEEHMFAFGANFSSEADSHLVCIQEGENYKTQAINMQNQTSKKVTGASFVVFTGSLKTSNPNDAKVSIIEDGIMIQMLPDAVLELRKALREMQDYVITTGSATNGNAVTHVNVEWVSRDTSKQTHISPIDGRSLTDVPSIQVHSSCDFTKRDIYRIRWTNVFLERSGQSSRGLASRGLNRLTGELARACCEALRPHLLGLIEMDLTRLSLRVNIDADSVEYSIGAKQKPLPANLMADLDSALIPSINAAAMKHRRGSLTVELFFSVISLF